MNTIENLRNNDADFKNLALTMGKALDDAKNQLLQEQEKSNSLVSQRVKQQALQLFSLQEERQKLKEELGFLEQQNDKIKAQYEAEEAALKAQINNF